MKQAQAQAQQSSEYAIPRPMAAAPAARQAEQESAVKAIIRRMPDDIRDNLITISGKYTSICWEIGDEVAHLYAWVMAESIQAEVFDACIAAVSVMDLEMSAFTVYQFYLVSVELNTEEMRDMYSVLPFSHLLWARQHANGQGKGTWTVEDILGADLLAMDENYGRPISLTKLQTKITGTSPADSAIIIGGGSRPSPDFVPSSSGYEGMRSALLYLEREVQKTSAPTGEAAAIQDQIKRLISQVLMLTRRLLEKQTGSSAIIEVKAK